MGTSFEDAYAIATKGRVLKPRFRVLVGDGGTEGLLATIKPDTVALFPKSANLERRYWASTDRFKVVLALCEEQDYAFWAAFKSMVVEVEIMYDAVDGGVGTPWILMFHGATDKVEFEVTRSGEVTISGRNTGSLLVNNFVQQASLNASIEDQVKTLVEDLGFEVDFGEAPPEGDFGYEVKGDKHHIASSFQSTSVTRWDKLARIAMETGSSLYEFNGVVYFHQIANGVTRDIWTVLAPTRTYSADGKVCKLGPSNSTSLRFTHDLLMTMYDQYVVQNENFHAAETNITKYPAESEALAMKNPTYIQISNKTADDIERLAKSMQASTGTREWHMDWTSAGPEMLQIKVVDRIEVAGTNSDLDGPYAITSIEHNIHWDRGLSTTVVAEWGRSNEAGGG